ncbi:hypothetical protein ACF1D3_21970 [Streptomyces sp. NPDC014728]
MAIHLSIPSAVRGVDDITRAPSAVISGSSSIRTPILRGDG